MQLDISDQKFKRSIPEQFCNESFIIRLSFGTLKADSFWGFAPHPRLEELADVLNLTNLTTLYKSCFTVLKWSSVAIKVSKNSKKPKVRGTT